MLNKCVAGPISRVSTLPCCVSKSPPLLSRPARTQFPGCTSKPALRSQPLTPAALRGSSHDAQRRVPKLGTSIMSAAAPEAPASSGRVLRVRFVRRNRQYQVRALS